jgi:hypothetical protein
MVWSMIIGPTLHLIVSAVQQLRSRHYQSIYYTHLMSFHQHTTACRNRLSTSCSIVIPVCDSIVPHTSVNTALSHSRMNRKHARSVYDWRYCACYVIVYSFGWLVVHLPHWSRVSHRTLVLGCRHQVGQHTRGCNWMTHRMRVVVLHRFVLFKYGYLFIVSAHQSWHIHMQMSVDCHLCDSEVQMSLVLSRYEDHWNVSTSILIV